MQKLATGVLSSPAVDSLGLGDVLRDQVSDETDDERKKRLAREKQMQALGPAALALGTIGNGGLGAI